MSGLQAKALALQPAENIMLITTLVVSFCKDGGGIVNVKL